MPSHYHFTQGQPLRPPSLGSRPFGAWLRQSNSAPGGIVSVGLGFSDPASLDVTARKVNTAVFPKMRISADLFFLSADGVKLRRATLDVLHTVGEEFATTSEGVALGRALDSRRSTLAAWIIRALLFILAGEKEVGGHGSVRKRA